MKTNVRIIGRAYKGNPVGAEVELDGPKARLLVGLNRAEVIGGTVKPKPAPKPKPVAKKAPAKKAAKKVAAKKTATKSITGTRNRSMRGQTSTK